MSGIGFGMHCYQGCEQKLEQKLEMTLRQKAMLLCQTQRMKAIINTTPDSITTSIFPEVDKILNTIEYQKSLLFVASFAKKKMVCYRSMMDFFFCELFTDYKGSCYEFYEEEGKPLRDVLSAAEARVFQDRLIQALMLAHNRLTNSEPGWKSYREEVLLLVA
jgi:hypothetical protein